jgi:hypothetical protein
MTDNKVKVSLLAEADRDFTGLPREALRSAYEAIQLLRRDPRHPALGCTPFAGMGSVFSFRLSAEYRAIFVGLSLDHLLILGADHRRNHDRLLAVAARWHTTLTQHLPDETAEECPPEAAVGSSPTRFATRATGLASRLAGSRRAYLQDDWAAVLAGDPEADTALRPGQQRALAIGFVLAAIRLRARDGARPLWRPVDWLLRVPSRTNAFIAAAVGGQALYIFGDDGLTALLTQVWEPCGIAGASLFALAGWLRRVRGIEVAPDTRHTDG